MRSRLLLLVLWMVSVWVVGCGSGAGAGPAGRSTTVRYVPGPGLQERYETTAPAGEALLDDEPQTLGSVLATVLQARDADSALRADPRLGLLARWVGQWTEPDGSAPGQSALDDAARQLGLVEPTPHILVIGASGGAPVGPRLTRDLQALLAQRAYSHFGGAVVQRDELSVYVLCLAFRFVELQPVPRALPAGRPILLEGQLPAGYTQAAWAVTRPDGQVVRGEREEPRARDARFRFRLQTQESGVYRVELLAQSALGVVVIANFPVYVGQPVPQQVALYPPADAVREDGPAAAKRLLALINAERDKSRLVPLEPDDQLAAVALAHNADMLEHGFIGHTSPSTGDAAARVARAGVRSGLTLENIGRGYSAEEVHAGLMQSPGHRGNILSPLATHVGIGVSFQVEDGHKAYLVTQVFTRVTPKLPTDARAQLFAAINRARAQQRRSQLQVSDELAGPAQKSVARCFDRGGEAAVMEALRSTLPPATRVSVLLSVASSLEDLAGVQALLEPGARWVGIGLAQGQRADSPPNSICALVLLAE